MYQMPGTLGARCISFDKSGLPLAVCVPAITQLFDPYAQLSQVGRPSNSRSAVVAGLGPSPFPKCQGPGAPVFGTGTNPACVDSSSSPVGRCSSGCGAVRSTSTPVGGWSRQEPMG